MIEVTDIHFASVSFDPPPQGKRGRMACYVHFIVNGCIKIAGCKIIEVAEDDGTTSRFLAMPSRKHRFPCRCGKANEAGSKYCNACGCEVFTPEGMAIKPADQVYPINTETRDVIETAVFGAWDEFVVSGFNYSQTENGYSYNGTPRPAPGLSSRVRSLLRSEA